MHIYALLVLVLAAKSVEPYSSCDRHKWNSADSMFHSLSNDFINLDKQVQATCEHFKSFAAREVFGSNSYRLEVYLPEFTSATFVVKIKHRVIYINGHYPRQGDKICDLTYVDIKVLPEFVSTHGAAWTYKNGFFIVGFPYARRIGDYNSQCSSQYIDESKIIARQGFPNERIFTD